MPRLALAGLLVLAGCSSAPPLPPVAPITGPTVISVPVLEHIPASMTALCPDPPRREIVTDVQLLEAADAWRVAKRCSDAKLRAIAETGKEPTP